MSFRLEPEGVGYGRGPTWVGKVGPWPQVVGTRWWWGQRGGSGQRDGIHWWETTRGYCRDRQAGASAEGL